MSAVFAEQDDRSKTIALLIHSIKNRTNVVVRYSDQDRTVNPHALGYTKDGSVITRVYQPNSHGQSSAGWKLMRIDLIQSIFRLGDPFLPAPGYKQGDKAMSVIEAEV